MPTGKSAVFYKGLFFSLVLCSLVLNVWLGMTLLQARREQAALNHREEALLVELAETLQQTEDKQEYLDRLVRDPDFRERVVREKLGRAREDEIIFHFQE